MSDPLLSRVEALLKDFDALVLRVASCYPNDARTFDEQAAALRADLVAEVTRLSGELTAEESNHAITSRELQRHIDLAAAATADVARLHTVSKQNAWFYGERISAVTQRADAAEAALRDAQAQRVADLQQWGEHRGDCRIVFCKVCRMSREFGNHEDDHYGACPHAFEASDCTWGLAERLRSGGGQEPQEAGKEKEPCDRP